jgi:hypothetical protein
MVPDGEVQPDPTSIVLADVMFDRRPLYAVLLSTTQDPDSSYSPIVVADQPEHNPTVTVRTGLIEKRLQRCLACGTACTSPATSLN